MRILFISKEKINEDLIRNNLSQIAEKDSIVFVYSYDKAEDFINNFLVKYQDTIDLIITHNNIDKLFATDFIKKINTPENKTFSNRNFNLNTIPVILLIDVNENKDSFKKQGFSNIIDNLGAEKLHFFQKEFSSAVRTWRSHVIDELDNLGIKFNSGTIDYTYYLSSDKKSKIDTKILSENFKNFPRKLNYYWLEINHKQIEKAIDDFIKQLKKTKSKNKKREEKLYHKFFKRHPNFILRDNYTKYWYESKLYYESKKFYEPDFTLKPNFNYQTDLSLLEIKLPNEGFIKQTKFHAGPYSKLINHLIQVNDYKDYLESEKYKETINNVFGYIPNKLEYNILIGRSDDKEENLDLLSKRLRQLGASNINLLTYDELLDYQVKFLDRMKILKIK